MKKALITLSFFVVGGVSIGLYQYYRTPEKAMEQQPVFKGSADGFAGILEDSEWETGAVVQLSDTIRVLKVKVFRFQMELLSPKTPPTPLHGRPLGTSLFKAFTRARK